jgi:starch synthase
MRIVQTVFGVFHHFELARELERRGHLEKVYSTWPWARLKREGLAQERVGTFPWVHVPEYALHRFGDKWPWMTDQLGYANALLFDEWTLRQMRRLKERPDAVVALAGSSLKAGRWLQAEGGRFVCDRGSTHARWQERILNEEYRRWGVEAPASDERDVAREVEIYAAADGITVASEFARRSYVEEGVPAEKVHVIPYGVGLESFTPAAEALGGATFEVLFVGHVSLRKGVPYLLEAFAKLRSPGKKLRVVGGIEPGMRKVLGRLPVEDVEFLGTQPREKVVEWMQRSHVLVLPSVEDGFGLVMAEAMACGCPVIASTHTGSDELYTNGVEGFVVGVRDVEAMAERMQRMADDRALQGAMRAAALERVRQIGGWAEYGERWENLLRAMTGVD